MAERNYDQMMGEILKGKGALTYGDIYRSTAHYRLGDVVLIPKSLLSEYSTIDCVPNMVRATVVQICTHHIVFRLNITGVKRSLMRYDCMQEKDNPIVGREYIRMVQPSGFQTYSRTQSLDDVLETLKSKSEGAEL